jgi:hypothetical protein
MPGLEFGQVQKLHFLELKQGQLWHHWAVSKLLLPEESQLRRREESKP